MVAKWRAGVVRKPQGLRRASNGELINKWSHMCICNHREEFYWRPTFSRIHGMSKAAHQCPSKTGLLLCGSEIGSYRMSSRLRKASKYLGEACGKRRGIKLEKVSIDHNQYIGEVLLPSQFRRGDDRLKSSAEMPERAYALRWYA